jgi:hypothetical protein
MKASKTQNSATSLLPTDIEMFGRLGIPPELLTEAHVCRVTDAEARRDYGMMADAHRDLSGVIFPSYIPPVDYRVGARLRRDHPEKRADGSPENKYITAWGDSRHLYFGPDAKAKFDDPDLPTVLVESAKGVLALIAYSRRGGMDCIPLGMDGCWGWRDKKASSRIAANGDRVDVAGPMRDLNYCNGRRVYILLDNNKATNPDVQQAESALIRELRKQERNCLILICDLPVVDGVNGPDDLLGTADGDVTMRKVFGEAYPPVAKVVEMPKPQPAAPLSADEAASLTDTLLEMLLEWIRRFVIITREQAIVVAFWVLHTYVMDAAEWTPYLHITAPEKETGKSLLMEVLAPLTLNPRTTSGTTPAAMVRIVDKYRPTLFLDEIDASTKGNKEMAEAQRGILNAGFKRGGKFYKCDGKDHEVRGFDVFGAKCFAGIGDLPDTIASRSIIIEMKRKLRSETIERRRSRKITPLEAPIQSELEKWGAGVVGLLKPIEPKPIDALHDRANDVTEILLAIAQIADADWPKRLTDALIKVYEADAADDTSTGVILLTDIRDIFATREKVPSKELATALNEIEGRPWAEWSHGKGLSANQLARQMKKYRIHPHVIWDGPVSFRGYETSDFAEAWSRYCPHPPSQSVRPSELASPLVEAAFTKCQEEKASDTSKNAKTRIGTGVLHFDGSKAGGEEHGPQTPAEDGSDPDEELRI